MFLKIFSIITIFFLISQTQAWVRLAIYHNPAYPGKCYVNEGIILSPGDSARSPEGCSITRCNNSDGSAIIKGCGKIASPENCRWVGYENVKADFPICCVQKFICDNPSDIENAKKLQDHIRDRYQRRWQDDQKH